MTYHPQRTPAISSLEELRTYIEQEFEAIARSQAEQTTIELRPIYAAPARPREGMIVSADGVSWDPGSGAGAYEYRGGAWVKL